MDQTTSNISDYDVQRGPGPSVQDVLKADGDIDRQPAWYREESYEYLGDEEIPFERYTSEAFLNQELEHMWTKTWQWACREENIPEPGDYHVYDVGPYSFIITRNDNGEIKAFYNACLHRGTKLKPSGSEGWGAKMACPFHGWSWDLDGNLSSVPCAWDFPQTEKQSFKLPEVRTGTWGGFIFINMDPDAISLEEYLAPLPEHAAASHLEEHYVDLHVVKELPCNWKTAAEAFLEAYHVMATHPQLMTLSGDSNTQYDVYSDFVSRSYTLVGVLSPHLEGRGSQQDIADALVSGKSSETGERLIVAEGDSARKAISDYRREKSKNTSINLEMRSTAEVMDTLQYYVFPNGFFFLSVGLPVVYRFRPMGVNKCLFDLMFLPPVPASGRPEPAEPHHLKVEDSFTSVPGMNMATGVVFDQDTSNMGAQQEGFLAAGKTSATFGIYQEVRLRHLHRTLDMFLAKANEEAV